MRKEGDKGRGERGAGEGEGVEVNKYAIIKPVYLVLRSKELPTEPTKSKAVMTIAVNYRNGKI